MKEIKIVKKKKIIKKKLGWREWVALPELGVNAIKVKVDTGAKTCALHAYFIEAFEKNGESWVRFGLHPNQGDFKTTINCEAKVSDRRQVSDSGGHVEERYIINTRVTVGESTHTVEITLTNRDSMRFRMLLGRNLLSEGYVVDAARSFVLGRLNPSNWDEEDKEAKEEEI